MSTCDIMQSQRIAEKIRSTLERASHDNIPHFTASFGVTELQSGDNQESLLERADIGLYQAKEQGKNQVFVS